jgi:dihydroxy-acid dehydratase
MKLLELGIRPRQIVTREALENAAVVVAASGGSTNAALHLPAIAHEAGIEFDLHEVAAIFKRTPYIADLKPGGRYVAKDMYEVGGVPILIKALLDGGYLHGDCLTVTGQTLAENHADIVFPTNQDVIRPTSKPLSHTGGVVGLTGNLAPQGRHREGRRHEAVAIFRSGPRFRLRGGRLCRGRPEPDQGRRGDHHPL